MVSRNNGCTNSDSFYYKHELKPLYDLLRKSINSFYLNFTFYTDVRHLKQPFKNAVLKLSSQ